MVFLGLQNNQQIVEDILIFHSEALNGELPQQQMQKHYQELN